VKAESDACCTSGNAIQVVDAVKSDEVILVPDRNLGHHVALHSDKRVILWDGWCPTHVTLQPDDVRSDDLIRQGAKFMAHPECLPEVLELADHVAGTAGMVSYVGRSTAREFVVGTESGLVYRLEKDYPARRSYPASEYMVCPTMKMTSLAHVATALEEMRHVLTVQPDVRSRARRALDAMLLSG
jgi:quinolinate synthase